MPALALIMASLTKCKALSCPLTLFFKLSSKWSSFSFSVPTNLLTGILVHFAIIAAIDSSSTTSLKIEFLLFFFRFSSSFSKAGIIPWRSLAAVSKSYLDSAYSKSLFAFSISSFLWLILELISFSCSQASLNSFSLALSSVSFSSISLILFLENSSFSFFNACFSTSNCIIFLVRVSKEVGTDSNWTLIVAHASSTKSIALSGKNLSVIYLSDKVAAATNALSLIVTPW